MGHNSDRCISMYPAPYYSCMYMYVYKDTTPHDNQLMGFCN